MFDRAFQFRHVPTDKGITHPGDTENRDDRLHTGGEDGTLYGFYPVCPGDEQDKGGSREHQNLDDMRHLHLSETAIGRLNQGRSSVIEPNKTIPIVAAMNIITDRRAA